MIRIQSTFITVALTLSACQFAKDPDKDKVDAAEVKVVVDEVQRQQDENLAAVLTDSDVVVEFTPLPEPHQYEMTVRWPERVPMVTVTLTEGKNDLVFQIRETNVLQRTVSTNRTSGDDLRILVEARNRLGHTINKVALNPILPRDFVISALTLSEDTILEFRRIFFVGVSGIITAGHNLNINVDELHTGTNTGISTVTGNPEDLFSTNASGTTNKINIQARKIVGHLFVHLHGLNGADGRDGSVLEALAGEQPPANGTPGSAGRNGILDLGCEPVLNEHRFLRAADQEKCRRQTRVICEVAPTNGTDGQDAPKAMDGENGFDGGHTGDLVLNTEFIDGAITIRRIAGRGGRGGLAAPARDGGIGGAAGALDPQRLCPPAQPGKNGSRGAAGLDGEPGKSGQVGLLILPTDPALRRFILVDDSRIAGGRPAE